MTVEDFVVALLVIAAAAPLVVPFVEWLFKRHAAKGRRVAREQRRGEP